MDVPKNFPANEAALSTGLGVPSNDGAAEGEAVVAPSLGLPEASEALKGEVEEATSPGSGCSMAGTGP